MARGKKPAATAAPQVPGAGFPSPGQAPMTPFGAPPGMPPMQAPPQQQFQQAPAPNGFPQQAPVPGHYIQPQAPASPFPMQQAPAPQAPQFQPPSVAPGFPNGPMAPVPGGLPGMAGQVNQDTVLGIMQQGGAGVSGDPAVAAAITGILGTLAELQKGQKAIQDTVASLSKSVSDIVARVNVPAPQAPHTPPPPQMAPSQMQQPHQAAPQPPGFPPQQQAPAPVPPTQVPNPNDPGAYLLQLTGQAVSQMLATANGQQFYDQDPAVWQALSTIAQQQNIQASPDQMRQLWHSAGKVQNGILVP